jgi:hypothetical protein
MRLTISEHHVLDDVVLRVKNDVSELSKVLNNVLCLEVTFYNDGLILIYLEIGVFDELFNDWIKNSIELLVL